MTTITQAKTFPNATPIEAIQAKIGKVYEYRKMASKFGGETTTQNVSLEDVAGNRIRLSIWDHPDLTGHEGKEYIFHSNKQGKGLVVKLGSYQKDGQTVNTVELSMSKAGGIQFVEVYKAPNGDNKAPASHSVVQAAPTIGFVGQATPRGINGAKVGMALNNAVAILVASGDKFGIAEIKVLALEIIALSDELEQGKPEVKPDSHPQVAPAKPLAAMTTQEKKEANVSDGADEDVPF